MSAVDIKDNEFNAELKRQNSMESQQNAKPRSSSFKDAENFVRTKSGTFVRKNSDSHSPVHSRSGTGTSTGMPEFRLYYIFFRENAIIFIKNIFVAEIRSKHICKKLKMPCHKV